MSQSQVTTVTSSYIKRFSVKKGNQIYLYHENDMAYFYANGKKVFMLDYNGEASLLGYTLDQLETLLNPDLFFRINRKYILSIDSILRMTCYDRYRIKIETKIGSQDDMIVSIDRSAPFKKWINTI